MISHGKSLLQAKIDDNAEVIEKMIDLVPRLIHDQYLELKKQAENLARDNSEGNDEQYQTIYDNVFGQYGPYDEEWMIKEFYRSIVLLICSYAETTMKSMINRPFDKRKNGIRYIEDSYEQVIRKNGLSKIPGIKELWPQYTLFFDIRNDIAHGYKDDRDYEEDREIRIDKDELYVGLEGAHRLVRTIADAIVSKAIMESRAEETSLTIDYNNIDIF